MCWAFAICWSNLTPPLRRPMIAAPKPSMGQCALIPRRKAPKRRKANS